MSDDNVFVEVARVAEVTPDLTAFIADKSWTYRDLFVAACQASGSLSKRFGVGQGDRLVISLDNSPEFCAVMLAAWRIGACVVPDLPHQPVAALERRIEQCGAKIIVTGDSKLRMMRPTKAEHDLSARMVTPQDLLTLTDDEKMKQPSQTHHDPAMVIFTSGTTGVQKGVVLSHQALLANARAVISKLGITNNDSAIAQLPFAYSYGNSLLLTHLLSGACLITGRAFNFPQEILRALRERRVTGFSTVGSFLRKLIAQSNFSIGDFADLQYFTVAGEQPPWTALGALRKELPALNIVVMYGQTEATARLTMIQGEELDERPGSVGRAIPGVSIRVVDTNGKVVAPGVVGEVEALGPSVMSGYWGQDDQTTEAIRDGWLRTGDTGYLDEDSYLYLSGRREDLLKMNGYRVSPFEIEAVIDSFPGVIESALVQIEKDLIEGDEGLFAWIVWEEGIPPNFMGLRGYLKQQLPAFKIPKDMFRIDVMPRIGFGKLNRDQLRRRTVEMLGKSNVD